MLVFELCLTVGGDCSIMAIKNSLSLKASEFKESLVAWGGIEPPTQGFSILCSTD